MKQMSKTVLILAVVMSVMSGCRASKPEDSTDSRMTEAAQRAEATEAAETAQAADTPVQEETKALAEAAPETGDIVSGFRVDSRSDSQMLQADVIEFTHEQSGAKLVWVKNSDPELAFSISYHTPYIDETDTNHVFEHGILASSEKYPSKNLFFDLAGKSYSTFVNAFTYNTFTAYPVSSESEEQLIKLIDAYLSCMVAPDILTNENIFRREAVRYELDSPEDEIRMIGTVYSEDFGFLTDMSIEAANNLQDALYPGQYASNAIGRSHRNYRKLTYEAVLDTYDRYYHFDNSLIFLYGDMDYEKVLGFIDRKYLSKAEREETDLSAWHDSVTEKGHVEKTVSVPAYEGDQTENAAEIDYGFSLEEQSWEDLTAWIVLVDALNHENSFFHTNLKRHGIQNQAEIYINLYNAKPYLQFSLFYGEPDQSQTFKKVVDETLEHTAREGVDEEILRSILKQTKTSNDLFRDEINAGVDVFPDIVNYWTHTGNCDFYRLLEQTLKDVEADEGQELFCRLVAEARKAGRSALVANVPEPGLAEQIIGEQDNYLAEMKASMSGEEIRQMIQDTKAFREWNESEGSNSDFIIDPARIPDEEPYTDYEKTEGDGVTYYMAPAGVKSTGEYRIYLDIGDFSDEERMDLGLYRMLAGNMGTREHTLEEILNLKSEYLYSYETDCLCPDGDAGAPMLRLDWITLTEDYEAGLALLLEMIGDTDFSDTERIQELLAREADFYDLSRADDNLNLARDLAASCIYPGYAYQEAYEGQAFYHYLKDIEGKLEEDSAYGAVLAERLKSLSDRLMKKGSLIFVCAAPESDLEKIRTVSAGLLEALPVKEPGENSFTLPGKPRKRAVIVESSDQCAVLAGNCYENEEFSGKYVPFLMAASDRYTVPRLRFQMGAYSSGISFSPYNGAMLMYSYSDPNGAETVRVFEGTADAIADMELTRKDLDGYILSAVAASYPDRGVLTRPINAMEDEILGCDTRKICDTINMMKQADIEDQKAAAECVREVTGRSGIATVGNETRLRGDQEAYDQLLDYKTGDK